jgi:hypothetical protein
VKKAMMEDGSLAVIAVEVTIRVLIVEVAVMLTALRAALTKVLVVKIKHLKISKALKY